MRDDEQELVATSASAYLAGYDKGIADQVRTDRLAMFFATVAILLAVAALAGVIALAVAGG